MDKYHFNSNIWLPLRNRNFFAVVLSQQGTAVIIGALFPSRKKHFVRQQTSFLLNSDNHDPGGGSRINLLVFSFYSGGWTPSTLVEDLSSAMHAISCPPKWHLRTIVPLPIEAAHFNCSACKKTKMTLCLRRKIWRTSKLWDVREGSPGSACGRTSHSFLQNSKKPVPQNEQPWIWSRLLSVVASGRRISH